MHFPHHCKQLLVGLPSTGKTTFLAALWHVVESSEVPEALRLVRLHGIRDHLNKIRQDWLNCKPLERTLPAAEKTVSMTLTEPGQDRTTELFLPDISGESFRRQWEDKQWTKEFNDLACEAIGALLFVHPGTVIPPEKIGSGTKKMSAALAAEENELTNQEEDEEQASPWTPDKTPTQVKLVELLQYLLSGPFSSRELRLAVVVSAWDLVLKDGHSPQKWLDIRLPLLAQFLKANCDTCRTRVYGVSAQGGELQQADQLRRHMKASRRIIISGPDCHAHDITEPIRWIMG